MEWYSIEPRHGKCMARLANGGPCPMDAIVTNEEVGVKFLQVCGGHFTCDVGKWIENGPQDKEPVE